jgi:predicted acetyltransferase
MDATDRIDVAMPDGLVLRRATPETLRASLSPLHAAFAEAWSDQEWVDRGEVYATARVVAAWDGDEPVATAGAETFTLTVPGGEIAVAGLTLVGVKPSHRRRGILRAIMRQQLDEYVARGEAVSILWASEAAIYQRFGYGLATLASTFEIERAQVAFARPGEPTGRMRMVDPAEALRIFPAVYERVRAAVPGSLTRDENTWRLGILFDAPYFAANEGPKFLAVHETDGTPDGYAVYRVKAGWDQRGPRSEVTVREVVGSTPALELGVWRWLLDLDLVAKVSGFRLPTPPALLLAVAEPRRLGVTVGDGLWLRILDPAVALEARRYAAPGALVLRMTDAFCPWNAGTWRIEVGDAGPAGGRAGACRPARVTRLADGEGPAGRGAAPSGDGDGAGADVDLELDVADLGAAYLGGIRFADLAAAARVREVRPGAIALADAMFLPDRPPACSTMF